MLTFKSLIRPLLSILDLFFPPLCVCCLNNWLSNQETLCQECMLDIPKLPFKVDGQTNVFKDLSIDYNPEGVWSFLSYLKDDKFGDLMHTLKYGDRRDLCEEFGYLLGQSMMEGGVDLDFLLPVPLHPSKLRIRGYNQSYFIGKGIEKATKIKLVKNVLKRKFRTKSQSQLKKQERISNVKNAFTFSNFTSNLSPKIGLVDDILTTGNTLANCAMAVKKEIPQARIVFLTLAVTNA